MTEPPDQWAEHWNNPLHPIDVMGGPLTHAVNQLIVHHGIPNCGIPSLQVGKTLEPGDDPQVRTGVDTAPRQGNPEEAVPGESAEEDRHSALD